MLWSACSSSACLHPTCLSRHALRTPCLGLRRRWDSLAQLPPSITHLVLENVSSGNNHHLPSRVHASAPLSSLYSCLPWHTHPCCCWVLALPRCAAVSLGLLVICPPMQLAALSNLRKLRMCQYGAGTPVDGYSVLTALSSLSRLAACKHKTRLAATHSSTTTIVVMSSYRSQALLPCLLVNPRCSPTPVPLPEAWSWWALSAGPWRWRA